MPMGMNCAVETLELKPEGISLNVELIRGTTLKVQLQWLDGDGVAIDNTGMGSTLTIRDASGNVILTLDETDGIALGGTNGFVDVEITPAQSAAFPLQRLSYNHDINTGSETRPLAYGKITVRDNTNIIPD
jgi:hypothetical protein